MTNKDLWLVYELGGHSLSNSLFHVKGEFYKSERIYFIHHLELYKCLKSNKNVLRQFLKKLFEAFDLLQLNNVVHADVKSDNILVAFEGETITDVKLIDFGSAFDFETTNNLSMSTPEYLAPEILWYLESTDKAKFSNGVKEVLKNMQPWSYDMWSVGALILEIITGFPLWLSLKWRTITRKNKEIMGKGIFGVQGRDWTKIYQKQKQLFAKNFKSELKKFDSNGFEKDEKLMDLLQKLMDFSPSNRISPSEALEHPFINQ